MINIITQFAIFIAIFLYGMTVMRIGLYNLSHKRMKQVLVNMTSTPLKGMIIGTIITAILQSSSAVMVITIGFIAAGLLTFKQSIGIILGTNIGTTITTEFITIDLIYHAIMPLLLIGALLLFTRKLLSFNIGAILFGLGCLFVAMNGFETLAKPLSTIPVIHSSIELSNENNLIGVGLGTLLTAVIQSSSATTGIIMGFMSENLVTLSSGIAIVLGANIGTCVTAFIASIGANVESKLAAYAHIWLNIFGVILFYPFIKLLGAAAATVTSLPDVQLAHVSVIFNVLSSIIALPLAGLLAQFIMRVHGKQA